MASWGNCGGLKYIFDAYDILFVVTEGWILLQGRQNITDIDPAHWPAVTDVLTFVNYALKIGRRVAGFIGHVPRILRHYA
jgi:hypothetical protein